jgi:putative phage-type endonuclease
MGLFEHSGEGIEGEGDEMNAPHIDINPVLDREGWLEGRRRYLGATDRAALVGKHRYKKTALDIYLEKKGLKKDEGAGRKAQAGIALEPLLRQWYSEEIGRPITGNRLIIDPDYDFLCVNLDGEIMDGSGDIVELKTMDFSTREQWGEPGTDEVPPHVYIQCVEQLATAGREKCHVVALDRGTMNYDVYYVWPDPQNHQLIKEISVKFWTEHVIPGIPPEPTQEDGDNIIYLFPKTSGEILVSDPALDDLADEMANIYRQFKSSEKEYDALKSQMKVAIGEAAGIETLTGKFTMSRVAGRVAWQKLAGALGARLDCPPDLMKELMAEFTGQPYLQLHTPF